METAATSPLKPNKQTHEYIKYHQFISQRNCGQPSINRHPSLTNAFSLRLTTIMEICRFTIDGGVNHDIIEPQVFQQQVKLLILIC